jgi:hypothetical protein
MGAKKIVDMSAPKLDECLTCHQAVIFVPSAKSGKTMILDATPKKGIVIRDRPGTFHAEAHVVDVYTDHHATCPGAKAWAGRNRSNPPSDEGVTG